MIVGNTITDSHGGKYSYGLSAGAYGHDPAKQSLNNIFASNHLERNGDTPGAPLQAASWTRWANSGVWISNFVVGGFVRLVVAGQPRSPSSTLDYFTFQPSPY